MSAQLGSTDPTVTLRDVSGRARLGCKGTAAEIFLSAAGLQLPTSPNGWCSDDSGRLVARLATSEFLVEATGADQADVAALATRLYDPRQREHQLVPVPRQDCVLELTGPAANELLRQTCNINFVPLARAATTHEGTLVLTMMVGVGVTVVPRTAARGTVYTIWADPSFGHYLWSTLADIARGLGGGILAGWGDGRATAP
jgi:sarcosine oxidase subunit gamma